jgi:hypothetical protein
VGTTKRGTGERPSAPRGASSSCRRSPPTTHRPLVDRRGRFRRRVPRHATSRPGVAQTPTAARDIEVKLARELSASRKSRLRHRLGCQSEGPNAPSNKRRTWARKSSAPASTLQDDGASLDVPAPAPVRGIAHGALKRPDHRVTAVPALLAPDFVGPAPATAGGTSERVRDTAVDTHAPSD